MILAVDNLTAGYGSARVINGLTFEQADGEILGIVGNNGMGKTTLLRTLIGLLPTLGGSIIFAGTRCDGLRPHRRSRLGMGYVPQGDAGFPTLTVVENLELARAMRGHAAPLSLDDVLDLFPRLSGLRDRRCGHLSGGERQFLAIARAVIRSPRLLMLDELTEGVQPSAVEDMIVRLHDLHRQTGLALIVVDQDLGFVSALAGRVLLMQKGELVQELDPSNLDRPNIFRDFAAPGSRDTTAVGVAD